MEGVFRLIEGDTVREVPRHTIDEFATRGDRPLAVDHEEGVAYLGVSAPTRAAALASLDAPDFTLPDLDGRPHSLSAHRGRKVLLVAYASW
jgi:hypothetical protein